MEKRLLCLARAVVRNALPPTLFIHVSSPMQVRISPSYWQAPTSRPPNPGVFPYQFRRGLPSDNQPSVIRVLRCP